jgi:exosortase A
MLAPSPLKIAPHWVKTLVAFGALSALLLVLFFPTWQAMAQTWWYTTAFNHGLVVLPISALLVWQRRRALRRMLPAQDGLGLALLGCFAFTWLLGKAAEVFLVQHVAVVGLLVGLIVALFGRAIGRFLWFPLLFLFFMVPFGSFLIPYLQAFTADFVAVSLRLIDVPVFQEGSLLMTPSGVFEVAEACAGLRFIIANVVVATLFAYWAYDRPLKWFWLLIVSLVVPVIANGLRALGVVYLAYLTDNKYATGIDHIVYGWGFFTATMLIILVIGSRFADRPIGWFGEARRPQQPPVATTAKWRMSFSLAALVVLGAAPVYAHTAMRLPNAPSGLGEPAIAVSTGWPRSAAAHDWEPRILNPDLVTHETYALGDDTVDFFVAYFAFERESAEAVNQRHRLADGETWVRTEGGWQPLDVDGLPSSVRREQLARSMLGARRLVLWWYWIGGEFTSSPWRAKALQVRDRLLGRATPAAIIAVSAPFEDRPETALETVEAFLQSGFTPAAYLASLAAAE